MSIATVAAPAVDPAVVQAALRAAVRHLDASSREVAAYHFGWADPEGRPCASNGGKSVRPTMAVLSARAAGADDSVGLPGAVAVELVHNFSLLHDDVMDGDPVRRHRPTVWSVFGVPAAILAGDAMLALAHESLLRCPTPRGNQAATLLGEATRQLIRGQFLDLAFERRTTVGLDECLDMVAGKTGALMSASAAIGAVLAGASSSLLDALSAYGQHAGVAFQLADDLLGIWGEPAVTGKPVLSDLRAHKKSLPVVAAMTSGGGVAEELCRWLAGPTDDTEAGLRHAASLVQDAGGRDWARDEAARQVLLAEQALADVDVPPAVADQLVGLVRQLGRRQA